MEECNMIKDFSKKIRLQAIQMAYKTGRKGSHLGGGLSAVEIFSCLYGEVLKPGDQLVVSKGHCVLAYYSALFQVGLLTSEDINAFETNEGLLHGHPTRHKEKGIEFSAGSLGMGLPFAVGVALSKRMKEDDSMVYCIVGDGECDEGSVWEALMSASHYKLKNLVVIVDANGLQYDGETKEIMNLSSLEAKMKAFGFETYIVDGHSESELISTFNSFHVNDLPKAVIAKTIKGKGVSFMEGQKEWHHGVLSEKQYYQALEELK